MSAATETPTPYANSARTATERTQRLTHLRRAAITRALLWIDEGAPDAAAAVMIWSVLHEQARLSGIRAPMIDRAIVVGDHGHAT